ncbi:MAG: flagellar motor protein MotB, partial [Elusimicrobiota bacterium]
MAGDLGGHGGGGARGEYDPSAWVVPYADLITTLMIFFLLMYAVSASGALDDQKLLMNIQVAMGGEVNKEEEKKIEELKISDKLKEHLQGVATIEINSERIKIMLPSPVLFKSGEADLKPEAMKNLDDIASNIKTI